MRRGALTLLVAFGLAGISSPVDASELRFSQTAAGGVVATGNTLGLSKELDANGPGTEDSIGTFITLDQQSMDDVPANGGNPWFAGTTYDWTANGSEADLVLGPDAQVLYAELIWGGSTAYGTEDVTNDLDSEVTLAFGGDEVAVSPDANTALTLAEQSGQGFFVNYYMRSADVTDFVDEHGAGTYGVFGVPATQDSLINSLNAAGWTLVVAYRDSSEAVKNLTIFVGGSFVDEDSTEDYDFAGFCTPPSGDFDGGVVISAIEGDADLTGDELAIAQTNQGPFTVLSGPNNPFDNFFASQINGPDGMLDETGTFGDRNHDAMAGTNVSAGRQSWDVTEIPLSSQQGHLDNDQESAVIRTQTSGDSYIPTLAAFEIEVNAPEFGDGTGAEADPTSLALDETSTVTIDMDNVGLVSADDLVLFAPLPDGLALDSFSIDGQAGDIDQNPVDANDLETGVNVGDVGVQGVKKIEIVVRSVGAPAGDQYVISPTWNYDYVMCAGEDPLTEPYDPGDVVIDFEPDAGTTDGGTETSGDGGGSSGEDGGTDSGFGTSAGQGGGDESGCGCTTGRRHPTPGAWLALVGLGLLTRRRRQA
jgi:MYXO-CTERM domain-containing protein